MSDLSVSSATDVVASLDFLMVDEFMKTLIDVRALKSAFELGLIDRLAQTRTGGSIDALGRAVGADAPGLRFLLDLLSTTGVIEERDGAWLRLTRRFRDRRCDFVTCLKRSFDFVGVVLNDFAD